MKILLIAGVLLIPALARADQCQLFDADVAARVRTIVSGPQRYAELCEPCGEKVPGVPFLAHTTEVGDELVLDGKPRDLAYLYVKTDASRFENVAMLAGCPVEGVSPSLAVEAETENGELITADATPVRVAPAPPPMEVAAAPPTAPPTYYSTTIVYAVPWVAVAAIAGTGGFLLGLIVSLLLVNVRRRRDLRPRAAQL